MAIDFPNTPSPNDTHTESGKTWKWDGTSWNIEYNNVTYTLPPATTNDLGGVKIDGTTITINNGVISSSGGAGGGGWVVPSSRF